MVIVSSGFAETPLSFTIHPTSRVFLFPSGTYCRIDPRRPVEQHEAHWSGQSQHLFLTTDWERTWKIQHPNIPTSLFREENIIGVIRRNSNYYISVRSNGLEAERKRCQGSDSRTLPSHRPHDVTSSIGHVLSAVLLCRSSVCSSPIPERVASGSGAPPPRRELLVLLSCVAHTKVRRGPPAPAKGKVLCSSPAALPESAFPKPPVDCRSHRVCSLHTAPRVSEKSSRDALRPLLVAPASPCLGFPSAGGACG
ncbi:hypothetical protein BDP67DRAFT_42671 [Colletotrichum lupini]|nr:hypothetical protein BDP67DRAFT_42671 [Colletotrichum lupini]